MVVVLTFDRSVLPSESPSCSCCSPSWPGGFPKARLFVVSSCRSRLTGLVHIDTTGGYKDLGRDISAGSLLRMAHSNQRRSCNISVLFVCMVYEEFLQGYFGLECVSHSDQTRHRESRGLHRPCCRLYVPGPLSVCRSLQPAPMLAQLIIISGI